MRISQRQILLIDEHLDTCEMMTLWFRSLDYTVTAAQTMAEGWRMVQRQHFDLCLLETRLSDGTGYELCRRIRTVVPDLPIVFYTTAAYEKDRQQGVTAGAHAYLVKPNDFERIPEVINGLLAKAKETSGWCADSAELCSSYKVQSEKST